MSKHCVIMKRLKENYESRSRTYLTRRIPVIMRLDGKAFHTYTKKLNKPFDTGLIEDMQQTTIYLCKNIQGAKCAYVQSDEISILITDYDKLETNAWFDYEVQKMTSISASLATGIFNQLRIRRNLLNNITDAEHKADLDKVINANCNLGEIGRNKSLSIKVMIDSFNEVLLANFDSRVANYPKEEVANYFLARQKDAVKNSISMLAQSLYSHKELEGVNSNDKQELCFQKGHNWNDLPFEQKRGSFIIKNTYINGNLIEKDFDINNEKLIHKQLSFSEQMQLINNNPVIRTKWEVIETPLTFTHEHFKNFL